MRRNLKKFLATMLSVAMLLSTATSNSLFVYADDGNLPQQEASVSEEDTVTSSLGERFISGEITYDDMTDVERQSLVNEILFSETMRNWFMNKTDDELFNYFGMSGEDLQSELLAMFIISPNKDVLSLQEDVVNKILGVSISELESYLDSTEGDSDDAPIVYSASDPINTKFTFTVNGVQYVARKGYNGNGANLKDSSGLIQPAYGYITINGDDYMLSCSDTSAAKSSPFDWNKASPMFSGWTWTEAAPGTRDVYWNACGGNHPKDHILTNGERINLENNKGNGATSAPYSSSFTLSEVANTETAPEGKFYSNIYKVSTGDTSGRINIKVDYSSNCTLFYKGSEGAWHEWSGGSTYFEGNWEREFFLATTDPNGVVGSVTFSSANQAKNGVGIYVGKVWLMNPPSNYSTVQTMVYADGETATKSATYQFPEATGSATLTKKSLCPNMTWNNGVYNINGAVYSVYAVSSASDKSTSNKVAEFTIKDDNNTGSGDNGCPGIVTYVNTNSISTLSGVGTTVLSGLPYGYYMCKETKKPDSGYDLSGKYYYIHVTDNNTQKFCENPSGSSDQKNFVLEPVENDPIIFKIKKQDSVTGEEVQGGGSLEGAVFRVRYYDTLDPMIDATTGKITNASKRTWYFETKKVGNNYWFSYGPYYLSSEYTSKELYTNESGAYVIPLGTISIEEVKAPEGYTLENAYIDSQGKKYNSNYIVIKIKQSGQNIGKYNVYNQAISEDILVNEKVIRGDVEFTKQDYETRELMAGVPFRITNTDTGESHIIVTDAQGRASTKSSDYLHTNNTNGNDNKTNLNNLHPTGIWFGTATVDNNLGALPYGKYTIEELKCNANAGKQMEKSSFEITKDGEVKYLGLITNMPIPVVETTALDDDTNTHLATCRRNATIVDTVSYKYLTTNCTYEVRGTLIDKETGEAVKDASGNAITAKVQFTTPGTSSLSKHNVSGSVKNTFTFDATAYEGKEFVVYEEIYYKANNNTYTKVVEHKDIDDEDQTVNFVGLHTTATSTDTDSHVSEAKENITIKDTVAYKGLIVGNEYRLTGTLMDADTGEAVLNEEGNPITSTKYFIAQTKDGTVDVYFTFNGVNLAGHRVVVFEDLYWNGRLYISHNDLSDEDQTVYLPKVGTTAIDSETREGIALADEEAKFIDTVEYSNLCPGYEYTVKGVLMDKETGEALLVDSEKVESEKTFTPDTKDGTVDVEFSFKGIDLDGKTLVVYEELYYNDTKLCEHKDIDDEGQTIVLPKVQTTAINTETNSHTSKIGEMTTIVDTVEYSNLLVGKEYKVEGTLYNKETGEELLVNGNKVTSEKTFTAEEPNGVIELEFTFDSSALEGNAVVVFEDLYYNNIKVGTHADITDEGQTVHFPKIGTTATDKATGGHMSNGVKETTIVDTVHYTSLVVGEEYTIKGILMNQETEEPVVIEGKQITSEVTFVPEESDGDIDLEFTFDGTYLIGNTVVVFEDLYNNGINVTSHADITDEGQTVSFPEVGTTAKDSKTLDHVAKPEEKVTIIDTVYYHNLMVGKEYEVKGILMNQETGEALLVNGKEVESSAKFVAEEEDGNVDVVFTFDASELNGKSVVVFEDIYENGKKVGTHAEITDEGQTIHYTDIGTTATNKATGTHVAYPDKKLEIVDTVKYTNLVVGKEYTVNGYLMVKETGEPLLVNGKKVTAEKTFKAKTANGTIDLVFKFDASALKGKTVVAFETISYNDVEVAVHADLEDEEQSIHIPVVVSTVAQSGGTKIVPVKKNAKIVDTVSYANLIPGESYTIKGTLMDAETGEKLSLEGVVETTVEFKPDTADGTIDVEFIIDTTGIEGKKLVVFEELYETSSKELLAEHKDINDEGQSVLVDTKPRFPKTGDNFNFAGALVLALITSIGGVAFFSKKRRR